MSFLKWIAVWACVAATAPWWLALRLGAPFPAMSEFFSLFPGRLGLYLRRGFYRMALAEFDPSCQVGFGTTFSHRNVCIARDVVIGNRCSVGMADIGEGVAIGSNVDILSGRYQHAPGATDQPVQYVAGVFTQVTIGRRAWVGNSAVVMADVGEQAVVGAGSVVVKPVPAGAVAVGNPAAVKKQRAGSAA